MSLFLWLTEKVRKYEPRRQTRRWCNLVL